MTRAGGEPIEVVVELEAASDPIRGSVRSDAGVRPFEGWMELTAAFEEIRLASGGNRTPGVAVGTLTDRTPSPKEGD